MLSDDFRQRRATADLEVDSSSKCSRLYGSRRLLSAIIIRAQEKQRIRVERPFDGVPRHPHERLILYQ